jgi:hypothetical protein
MNFKDLIPSFLNFDKPQPKSANALAQIKLEQQLQRVRQDAQKLKLALASAESPLYPNRFMLMQTYQEVVRDSQISASMLQRKMQVMSQRFHLVNEAGEPDDDKTKLLKAEWFYTFMDLALDPIFYGHSAIQFSPVRDSKFLSVELIPRIYVVPEYNIIRSDTVSLTGINYTEKPYSNWCIGVGKKKDLGLLMKLAPYAIWKSNAMGAWAEFAEIFGSPMRITRTDVRDEAIRKNAENMMRNMGVATWAVLDLNDQYEILETKRTDSFNVFDKMVERCNSEISKIVLGQTGTTDEKSFVGSADVHKDIANQIGRQDQLMMEFIVNDQLIPMMNGLGFDLGTLKFEFDLTENVPVIEQAKIDAAFMPYVKFKKEYLEKKYGIEIDEVIDQNAGETDKVAKKLKNLYS